MLEIEIRARMKNHKPLQAALRAAQFSESDTYKQTDIILDRPDASLFRSGQKIRIRVERRKVELTYKGVFQGDDTASRRHELTLPIRPEDIDKWTVLFEALGYPECFRIPKTRKVFRKSPVKVSFDEWPIIGMLVEIEGPESACKEFVKKFAPDTEFRNFRLKELLRLVEKEEGRTFPDLKRRYEGRTGIVLGRLELLLD